MNERTLRSKHFYFCYDADCAKFLREVKGVSYVCNALTEDEKEFYLFRKSLKLTRCIQEYNESKKYALS